jgi:hypothetical protein
MDIAASAYIAGLIDGEGCMYVERFATTRSPLGYQYRIMVSVTMCDKESIEFVCDATNKNYRSRKLKSGRTAYTVDFRNSIAYELLQSIDPYLRGKRKQAFWCMYFNEELAPGRGHSYTLNQGWECENVRVILQFLKGEVGRHC